MRLLRSYQGKEQAHVLHIGKTGGTAVKIALMPHTESSSRYWINLHPHRVRLVDIPAGEKVIFFLRDPLTRFVSGFYSRQRQGRPLYESLWTSEEKLAFAHFTTANQLAEALSSTDLTLQEKATQSMKSIRHVNTSYWNWFQDETTFRSRQPDILFVGYQESLEADFRRLQSVLRLPAGPALPDDDARAHRNPGTQDHSLSEQATANLKRWYQEDYAFLELCHSLAV